LSAAGSIAAADALLAILVAFVVNMIVKLTIVGITGGRRLLARTAPPLTAMAAACRSELGIRIEVFAVSVSGEPSSSMIRSIAADVRPVRIVWRRGSRSVLELPAGEAARVGLRVGSELSWHHQGR
jgi:hypothetical protein